MKRNRRFMLSGAAVALVALVGLWSLFRPELLFVNTTVNEAPPQALAAATPQATSASTTLPASSTPQPQVTNASTTLPASSTSEPAATSTPAAWSAHFESLAHATSGTATVQVLADGMRVLRLEDFMTSNGPDVRVYLVRSADGTQDATIARGDFVDLGALKGNIGSQNYSIPAEVDLSQYHSVSIWCRRFSVNFGATRL